MTDPVRRVHYFPGQLLTMDDLQAEQDYNRRMRYLANRLHGWGIVEGLEVDDDVGGLVVKPGFAIDPLGREIVLTEDTRVAWTPDDGAIVVWITWGEEPDSFVAGDDPYGPPFTRWLEQPRVVLTPLDVPLPDAVLVQRRYPVEDVWTSDSIGRPLLGVPPPAFLT